jgi:hypothetical protein
MLKNVPRAFLVLLAIFFLLDIVGILIEGNVVYLARTAVLAFAAWRALRGSRPAAVFLAALMSLGAIAGLYGAYKIYDLSLSQAIGQLIFVAFLGSIVGYIFLSPKLKSFYAASSTSYWSGGD